jgi:hypothetical protein
MFQKYQGISDGCEVNLSKWKVEEFYIEQREVFQLSGKENYVCKMKKELYGLKQAPRERNSILDRYLQQQGFKK